MPIPEAAPKPPALHSKFTVRLDDELNEAFRPIAFALKAEGLPLNEIGVRLVKHFVGLTESERRKLLGLPKAPRAPKAKASAK